MTITEGRLHANGLEFGYLEAGEGPLALCLHGFPDSAWTWRHLLPVLADAGFRAVAPWLRGYAPTEVPADGVYQAGVLIADTVALHDALGGDDRAVIVGHDWGAVATYGAAAFAPRHWRRVVAMAIPPGGGPNKFVANYDQIKRSFYVFFLQSPLADKVVPLHDLRFIEELWRDWSPGYDGTEDVAHAKDALRKPANLTAAIDYYRAIFDPTRQDPKYADQQRAGAAPTPQPTLYLHGLNDGCMGVELSTGAEASMGPGSRVQVIEGAGHFLHVERPAEVNGLIADWLTS